MKERSRVVFVSQRNSLRSVVAHACLAHLARKRFVVASCGQPGFIADSVHPAAVGALNSASIAIPTDAPQSWHRLIFSGAPVADFIITLDEEVAALAPRWPGQPDLATWSFPDIASVIDAEQVGIAAIKMLYALHRRLELFSNLPLAGSDRSAIRSDVRDLAHHY